MTNTCPTCRREFLDIGDFPSIFVERFERFEIPGNFRFPASDRTVYVGQNSKTGNPRPPERVMEFFKQNETAKEFDYCGWQWTKSDDRWHGEKYSRSASNLREQILERVNPYLRLLEGFIGREVTREELLFKQYPFGFAPDVFPEITYSVPLLHLDPNKPFIPYSLGFREKETTGSLRVAELTIQGNYVVAKVGKLRYVGK